MGKDTIRAFVAIEIDDKHVVTNVKKLQEQLAGVDGKLKLVDPAIVHVTLKFLGDITGDTAKAVFSCIQELDIIPDGGFDIDVTGTGVFTARDPRVVWMGLVDPSGTIARAQSRLDDALHDQLGIPREKRKFEGHVTLARVKSLRDKASLASIVVANAGYTFGTQHVDSILLKQSVLTPRGPIYSTLVY